MGDRVTLAVVGAGNRGTRYTRLAIERGARIVAVADPNPIRRDRLAEVGDVPPEQRFGSWEQLVEHGPMASAAIVATPDHLHHEPAIALLGQGYDLLLEKPMARREEDAVAIVQAAEAAGRRVVVAHVMRYQPVTRAIMSLLGDDGIGEVVSVQLLEPIGDYHFTHSYVRGNWRNEADSTPVLLSKSCHDIDWLAHVIGQRASRVTSFGGLREFRSSRAPEGAADRCLDCGVEATCPFSAKKVYLDPLDRGATWDWPVSTIADEASRESVVRALRDGPYGRCVYRCDNDVPDHQVVNVEYENGATASFMLSAFTPMAGRKSRIGGTRGHLDVVDDTIEMYRFIDRSVTRIDVSQSAASGSMSESGHQGGDGALIDAFLHALSTDDWSVVPTNARVSLDTHRVVWAAERARRTNTVVDIDA
jgi:predicted dehydrogenase